MLEADFFEVSDEFVNLANELTQEWAQPMVSAAVMHAASRFNAYHLMTEGAPDDMNVAVDFLTNQYRQMLIENLRELKSDQSSELKGDI
ncbi:MAG: DUF3144 domain-containing protein [Neptuniibacter sp.]